MPGTAPHNSAPSGTRRFLAVLLSLLLPGLGYAALGQAWRTLWVMGGVLGLFAAGLLVGGPAVVDRTDEPLWFLPQACAGPAAFAADYVHQNLVKSPGPDGVRRWKDPEQNPTLWGRPVVRSVGKASELGILFTAIAGMMNIVALVGVVLPAPWEKRA